MCTLISFVKCIYKALCESTLIWIFVVHINFKGVFTVYKLPSTIKPVENGHSKIDKAKVLTTNGSLMKVKSIAECSKSILQYF